MISSPFIFHLVHFTMLIYHVQPWCTKHHCNVPIEANKISIKFVWNIMQSLHQNRYSSSNRQIVSLWLCPTQAIAVFALWYLHSANSGPLGISGECVDADRASCTSVALFSNVYKIVECQPFWHIVFHNWSSSLFFCHLILEYQTNMF